MIPETIEIGKCVSGCHVIEQRARKQRVYSARAGEIVLVCRPPQRTTKHLKKREQSMNECRGGALNEVLLNKCC
jgi:hypothetical protein